MGIRLRHCGTVAALDQEMRFSFFPVAIVLSLVAFVPSLAHAQVPSSKAEAIIVLDEFSPDNARFERVASLAKSLGVSNSRIVLTKFANDLLTGNLDSVRRNLPEIEAALKTLPPDESTSGLERIREAFPKFKKLIGQNDTTRLNVLSSQYKQAMEAVTVAADLLKIDAAVDICAIKGNLQTGATVPTAEWIKNVPIGTRLRETGADIFGNRYGDQVVGKKPEPNTATLQKIRR